MREVNGLSVAFAEAHPGEAGGALESLAVEHSAAFLGALAPRLAANVLRHMSPQYCARVIEQLEEEPAAELCAQVEAQAAAQIFRHLSAARRAHLLARLPVGTALAVRMLTEYPKGTCGASMDPGPLVLAPETAVADALERARRFEGDLGDCLFVADGARRLLGVAALGDLVRAAPPQRLSAVMRPAEHTVSALASLHSIAGHPGWEAFHVLPVVEREHRLVGALRRHALLAALGGTADPGGADLAAKVTGAYWETLLALAQVVLKALPAVKPVNRAGRDHDGG
jgi:Mg/Co/Ni transporter MgtE